jgi:aspartate aminotransferase
MPSPSQRGQNIGASPIRNLIPYANEAKAKGKNIIHLNIGQPDIETPAAALKTIQQLSDPIVSYGPSEGLPELRETVAHYYQKFDAQLTTSDVYVTTGASEAILFTLLACCDNDDEVIIPEPFYANYLGFAHLANVKIVPLTTHIETGFALPEPAEFEKQITAKTKAIFLCNPGNPTGQLYNGEQLERLMHIVKKHQLFLIVDEVYREFCYDEVFTSVLSFRGMEANVVVIDSISKVFSACGARVGYLITKNKQLLEAVIKYAQLRLCPPYYGQHLALACYDNPDSYIEKAKQEYARRRIVLHDGLSKINGVQAYKPSAAFYNMVQLPVADAEHFCKWLLTDFEKNGNTVMMAPGDGFYAHKELGRQQVRMAYVLKEADLALAMDCLTEGLLGYEMALGGKTKWLAGQTRAAKG